MYPGWFPDTLPSPNYLGVAVLLSISSCAPRSTFTFTFRVLCIIHVSYTQLHSLHNQQALKLSHSHLVSSFIAMAFSSLSSSRCLWCWMLKSSSSVWSIHRTAINLDILHGASYPSSRPLLPLISFEILQSMQCFIIQDILQISSIVLDIIKTISISPRRTILIISPSPRTFQSSNGIPTTNGHDKRSSV